MSYVCGAPTDPQDRSPSFRSVQHVLTEFKTSPRWQCSLRALEWLHLWMAVRSNDVEPPI